MQNATLLSPPESKTLALVREENGKLTLSQRERKAYLLSRFRVFAKEYGGIPDYEPQPHDEMCDYLEVVRPEIGVGTEQKKEIYLAPRHTYKTSLEKAYMTYLMLFFWEFGVDISIDYVRATLELAQDVLFELKHDLRNLETIQELWPTFADPDQWLLWSANRINISGRRDNTIAVSGLDRGSAGKHPDVVILDDMVNEKNYDSLKAKRAARTKLQGYYPILPPWGALVISGTRFAHNDVYGWQLTQNAHDRKKYEELVAAGRLVEAQKVKPQWIEYIRRARDANGELFFPAVLTESFLAQQKRSLEPKFYAAFYDNSPDVEGMVRFRSEYLQYFNAELTTEPFPVLTLLDYTQQHRPFPTAEFPVRVTMTLDPTLTAQRTSDLVGMTVVAADSLDNWFVLYAHDFLEVPSKISDIAIDLLRRYRPAKLRIESGMADPDMIARIQSGIIKHSLPTIITSYSALVDEEGDNGKVNLRKKNARIESLEPKFRNGQVWLHRGTCERLYEQYINWPDVDHDDVFDALAMQRGIAVPCAYKSVDDYEAVEREREDDEPGWSGQLQHTLYDRWGNPVKVTAQIGGDQEIRLAGRAGLGAQRLRVR